ncbi:MAG TPA: HDIG domain-containing protein [Candidatus Atribacteria bacterium]|nr:HDIG domain-containing protein [Candidatus Atribacteria bacterium]
MSLPVVRRDKPIRKISTLRMFHKSYFWNILIAVLTFFLIFFILFSAVSPERYELKVGDIAPEPIPAPRDVEDVQATQAKRQEAMEKVPEYYTLHQNITASTIATITDIFDKMDEARSKAEERLRQWEEQNQGHAGASPMPSNVPEEEYDLPTPDPAESYDKSFMDELESLFPVKLSYDDIMTILNADKQDLNLLKSHLIDTMQTMLEVGIKEEQLAENKINLTNAIQSTTLSNELKLLGTTIGVTTLKPNLLYDYIRTNQEKQKAAAQVEKVMYKKGQYIVEAGQPVTEAQINMLAELGLLKNNKMDVPLIAGIAMAVFICLGLISMYMAYYEKELVEKPLMLLLISMILCLTLGLTYVTTLLNRYLIPAAMAGMLLAILIRPRIAIVINMVLAVLIGFMTGMQLYAVVMTFAGGLTGILMVKSRQQRNSIIWAGVGVAAVCVLTLVSIDMVSSGGWQAPLQSSFFGLMSGLLSSILTIGTLPIWENIFGIITPIRLVELSNPNQPLLKRLLMETPGTYHHSIIVGNLAESAADAIGANGLLARVGAYYHDIGKLVRPYYFKENQLYNQNPHDKLNPVLSKKIIIAHIKDGLELAKKYKLPGVIQDFIAQHHGTTVVAYFYHKAKNNNIDMELDEFRYPGPKPTSKETALVMLADTAEAAVRAMADHSSEKIGEQIRKLIRDKFADGQLDNADLTMKDLDKTAEAFTNVISGIFHERVEYPDINSFDERTKTTNDIANGQQAVNHKR